MSDKKSCSCGGSSPSTIVTGGDSFMTWPVERVMEISPQLALARAAHVPLAPWYPNIRANFTSSANTPIGPFSWQLVGSNNDQVRLNTFGIVDRIVYQIDDAGNNAGYSGKPEQDFYFGYQSGIEATLMVDGDPRYVPAPDYTPLRSLCTLFNEAWPSGWLLTNTNVCKMQFNISNAALIPQYPCKVTVTFRLWVPNVGTPCGKQFVMMTDSTAYDYLEKMGYETGGAKKRAQVFGLT
jgi:hypothetical protein